MISLFIHHQSDQMIMGSFQVMIVLTLKRTTSESKRRFATLINLGADTCCRKHPTEVIYLFIHLVDLLVKHFDCLLNLVTALLKHVETLLNLVDAQSKLVDTLLKLHHG